MTKFVVTAKSIVESTNVLSKTITETETRMILKSYLGVIDKKKNQLVMFGTDLNLGAVVVLPLLSVEGDDASRFTVDAKTIEEIAECNKDADLLFEVDGLRTKVKVRAEDREVDLELVGLDPVEFPKMQDLSEMKLETIVDMDTFFKALSMVSYAMATTATKIDLMGVYTKEGMFVASNGQRLQTYQTALKLPEMVIPDVAVKQLMNILPQYAAKSITTLSIGIWNQFIIFKIGDDLFSVRMRVGGFFKRVLLALNQVEKYNPDLVATIDVKKVASLLRTVRLSADEQDQRVSFKFEAGKSLLTMSAKNLRGSNAVAKVEAGWKGPKYEIVLSSDYIVEALQSIPTDLGTIGFGDLPTQPVFIATENTKAVIASVVTPIKPEAKPAAAKSAPATATPPKAEVASGASQ